MSTVGYWDSESVSTLGRLDSYTLHKCRKSFVVLVICRNDHGTEAICVMVS